MSGAGAAGARSKLPVAFEFAFAKFRNPNPDDARGMQQLWNAPIRATYHCR